MDVEDVAGELYGLAPGEFTATRNARAAQARKEGDRHLADAIGSLRKPTVGAWAVNQLARQRAHELGRLLELGPALRAAQVELSGGTIRQLSRQRQKAVRALVDEARSLAHDAGQSLTDAGQADVGHVLERALASSELADTVRSGRLTSAREAGGGGFALDGLLGAGARQLQNADRRASRSEQTRHRQRELADVKRRTRDARQARVRAEKALERVRERVAHAEEHLGALRAAERAANHVLRQARQAEEATHELEQRTQAAARSRAT